MHKRPDKKSASWPDSIPVVLEVQRKSGASELASRPMPLVPAPIYDEAFGSWLRRCAAVHGFRTISEFIAGALDAKSRRLTHADIDWDTKPPEPVLEAMAKHSGLSLARMQLMVVKSDSRVLRPSERDAYCPRCFQEDLKWRAIYTRRAWLDSWAFVCSKHKCILGRYEGFDNSEQFLTNPMPLTRDDQIRLGTLTLGRMLTFGLETGEDLGKWFDVKLLKDERFRSLILLAGSIDGDVLSQAARTGDRHRVWTSDANNPISWLEVQHPRADIITRLQAAYVASVVWPCIGEDDYAPGTAEAWLHILFGRLSQWNRRAVTFRLAAAPRSGPVFPRLPVGQRRVPKKHASPLS